LSLAIGPLLSTAVGQGTLGLTRANFQNIEKSNEKVNNGPETSRVNKLKLRVWSRKESNIKKYNKKLLQPHMQQFHNAPCLKPNERCLTSETCWGLGLSTAPGAAPSPTNSISLLPVKGQIIREIFQSGERKLKGITINSSSNYPTFNLNSQDY